jgi:hypothetical protein
VRESLLGCCGLCAQLGKETTVNWAPAVIGIHTSMEGVVTSALDELIAARWQAAWDRRPTAWLDQRGLATCGRALKPRGRPLTAASEMNQVMLVPDGR